MNKIDWNMLLPKDTKLVSVVGLSYGDEWKGKVGASLYDWYTIAAWVNGGGNAGHNVMLNWIKVHFHELPWASIHAKIIYLWQWKVINITNIEKERQQLAAARLSPTIIIAWWTHVVIPAVHKALEQIIEDSKNGHNIIWSTFTWMGPTYGLKSLRINVTVGQLLYDDGIINQTAETVVTLFPQLNKNNIIAEYTQARTILVEWMRQWQYTLDIANSFVPDVLQTKQEHIIAESSQSVMLSLSGGQYPFVTSSECGFNAIPVHLNTNDAGYRIGVTKAIASKVWWWRFPTKRDTNGVPSEIIDAYRNEAGEYGATTWRPRQIGYLDAVQLRHAFHTWNRPDLLWINMGDKLPFLYTNNLDNKVAVAYKTANIDNPLKSMIRDNIVPPPYLPLQEVIYKTLPDVKSEKDYPNYVDAMRDVLSFEGPIVLGVGPGCDENILFAN